jgi:hypothetical protein
MIAVKTIKKSAGMMENCNIQIASYIVLSKQHKFVALVNVGVEMKHY